MPWCDTCSKYLTPTGLHTDGTCPTCGRTVAETVETVQPTSETTVAAEERTPWHFKLLIAAVAVYLIWRLIQMIGWLF